MFYTPNSILFSLGPINVYWYGLTMALGLLAGLLTTIYVARWYGVVKETIVDLFFYLVILGFLGARLFFVLYELPYFFAHPLDIFKIWEGGIAIHGGIIAGVCVVWWFARKIQRSPWLLAAIITPGLALGQAIGRWGNFFNQELFGLPTSFPWGIPIDTLHRPALFAAFTQFHPTFLYESIGNFLIFGVLLWLHLNLRTDFPYDEAKRKCLQLIVFTYIFLYSLLRFATETLRLDPVSMIVGVRVTMWLAIFGMVVGVSGLILVQRQTKK